MPKRRIRSDDNSSGSDDDDNDDDDNSDNDSRKRRKRKDRHRSKPEKSKKRRKNIVENDIGTITLPATMRTPAGKKKTGDTPSGSAMKRPMMTNARLPSEISIPESIF